MQEVIQDFFRLKSTIESENGEFTFFALFQRIDKPSIWTHRWDFVVAAPWLVEGSSDSIGYIGDQIKAMYGAKRLSNISQIAVLDHNHPAIIRLPVELALRGVDTENLSLDEKPLYIRDLQFSKAEIEQGFIFAMPSISYEATDIAMFATVA
ncbi:MAG: hypothetical protein AAF639_33215 [Chloroflexota bacterium]